MDELTQKITVLQRLITIPYRKREIPFLIFSSFLVTFIYYRLTVYFFPQTFINIKGVHIHHFSLGLFLLSFLSFYLLMRPPQGKALRRSAIIYGIALAMAYDEFGMWLRLQDDYWTRRSYDAIGIIAMFFLNLIYFPSFWLAMGGKIKRLIKFIF